MRIDLCVPYSQKDMAKAKGARWDPARHTWYVIDPLDVKAFAMWMGKEVQDWYSGKGNKKSSIKANSKSKPPIKTGPKKFVPLCHCNVLPWEDCEHTDAMAASAMKEMLS